MPPLGRSGRQSHYVLIHSFIHNSVWSALCRECRIRGAGGSCKVKVKVKEADLYSTFIVVPHTQGAQVWITQCYLQITLCRVGR